MMQDSNPMIANASSEADPWGVKSADWADVQEPLFAPVYKLILDICGVGRGTRVLDVGCGAGKFVKMAAERGAVATGIDDSGGMIKVARRRAPDGQFLTGQMDRLPFSPDSFELVTGFNSFSHAEDQLDALSEARRVALPGGPVAVIVWSAPRTGLANQAIFNIMPSLLPDLGGPEADVPDVTDAGQQTGPNQDEDPLARLARDAGLMPRLANDVECQFVYPDDDTLIRGFMSPGPFVEAAQRLGDEVVRNAILSALGQFRTATDGYSFTSGFRYLVATA